MILTRTPFIPARNSRHRIAAIALYRALIKSAHAVPLPPGDTLGPEQQRRQASAHPLANIVRRRFDRNKRDDSQRLVFSSMAAGYKFLTLLAKARTPDSPEHTRVLNILQTHQAKAAASRARAAARPRPPEREKHPPLIINVAPPGEPPVYKGTARPKSDFTGPRRVPTFGFIAEGFPFLRYTKPQPENMSAMIGKRRSRWTNKTDAIRIAEEQLCPHAALEDQWENLVLEQQRSENDQRGGRQQPMDVTETYLWSELMAKMWHEHKLNSLWEDWTARGKGLYDLLKEERALAEQEGETPRYQVFGSAPTLAESDATLPSSNISSKHPSELKIRESPSHREYEELRKAAAKAAKGHGAIEGEAHDFFTSPAWKVWVEGSKSKLVKWAGGTKHWSWDYVAQVSQQDRKILNNRKGDGRWPDHRSGSNSDANVDTW